MKKLLLSLVFLSGCAHSVHDVYVSDFGDYPKLEQGEMVSGRTEQFVVLGFVTETDYVETARKQLMQKCPNGDISGISTQYSTSLGFFSWTNKILMQGLCTKPVASATAVKPKPQARK